MTDGRTPDSAYAKDGKKTSNRSRLALSLLASIARRLGWRYALYLPAMIGLAAAFLLPPRFLQFFTGSAEQLEALSGERFLLLLASFGLGIAVALWLSTFLGGLLREWLRLRVSLQLRQDSLQAIHATSLETFDEAHRGDWMTRLTSDLHNVEEFLSDSLPQQVQNLTLVLGSAALFFIHSGPLALVPCLAALALAGLNARVQQRMAPTLTTARELEGEVFQDLMESYEGWRTIRSTGAAPAIAERFGRRLESVRRAGMKIIRSMAGLMGVNEFASQLVVTALLTLLAWSLRRGELTAADVLVYPFFINVFLGNARALAASAYDWNRFFVEGGRLAEVLQAGSLPPSSPGEAVAGSGDSVSRLTITGLSARYPDHPPLFSTLDFSLSRGQLLALTGPSGSGKSTLLEILAGLRQPWAGRISLGDGTPTLSRFPEGLGAFVEQRPYFFVGTLRENLTLGLDPGRIPPDAAIGIQLESLGLGDAVARRGGLDATLADRGLNFSEGQRYRLALCRALLGDRPFLWLDEPFASVDPESVTRMIDVLEQERASGRGIVIATHQLPEGLEASRLHLERPVPSQDPAPPREPATASLPG